jgi:hypothetical protein
MKKSLALRLAAVSAFVLASAGSAMAAVPAEVTTAIGDMKADGLVVAGAVLVAIIAIAAVKFIRKGL